MMDYVLKVGEEVTLRLYVVGELGLIPPASVSEMGAIVVNEAHKGELASSEISVTSEVPSHLSIVKESTQKIENGVKYELTVRAELPGNPPVSVFTRVNGELMSQLNQRVRVLPTPVH